VWPDQSGIHSWDGWALTHQSLGYQTPDTVYQAGVGGGALIVDRFSGDDEKSQKESSTGQRRAAEEVETDTA
jgi:putative transposase